jgi:hypothetical protein
MKFVVVVLLLCLPMLAQSSDSPHLASRKTYKKLSDYEPITSAGRLRWFASSTAGPIGVFFAGPISAGWGTMLDRPKEYGPHWGGFADRYGMRFTGISTGNAVEAGLGALWGEDPRYFRSPHRGFGTRTKYVIESSFLAPYRDGSWHPAYARYIGNVGNNFLSNTWRVPSERGADDALTRCAWGIVADIAGNALTEFWPDVKKKVFGR